MEPLPPDVPAGGLLGKIRDVIPSLDLTWKGETLHDWAADLAVLKDEDLLGVPVVDASMAALVRCGILVRADLFDEPHAICQAVPTATGSYWHGILHRREPDFHNSRYWFRRVGEHPLFPVLRGDVASLAARPAGEWRGDAIQKLLDRKGWDPFLMIELCESCDIRGEPGLSSELGFLQELEIDLLLRYCYEKAVGRR